MISVVAVCYLAVAMYLFVRIFSRRKREYPPWKGMRPWLENALCGAVLGAVLWVINRYVSFLGEACKGYYPGESELADVFVVLLLPAFFLSVALDGWGRAFAWSLVL